jgi:putative peptidoglycan lipid II flippase
LEGPPSSDSVDGRWKTVVTIVLLVVTAKGLAFIREAFVASELGASSSSDGYYLGLAMPTVIYSLGALPFSMWVTARLAALKDSGPSAQASSFYLRSLLLVLALGIVLGLLLFETAGTLVRLYAPGLEGRRFEHAVVLSQIGLLAIPALGIQAVCNGRLFADGRFLPVYVWLVIGGLVGLAAVVILTPTYGAAGAVWAFVAAGWSSIVGPALLARVWVSSPVRGRNLRWADDLGASVVYRALIMQLYFQASLLLIYAFGSALPEGELSAALFGSKIQTAVYESLAVTAGVLVYPEISRFLQISDHLGVRRTMMKALNWLVPATAGIIVLLITCRAEIVTLIYQRKAFDDHAARLVAAAVTGYAPGIVGLTFVEILHRAMVLRGRVKGYAIVFSAALLLNWICYYVLVPILGVLGLTLSSSVGVLAAGAGLLSYASKRLTSMDTGQVVRLVGRTTVAAGLTLAVLMAIHARLLIQSSSLARLATVAATGAATAVILSTVLLALGHRWWGPSEPPNARG